MTISATRPANLPDFGNPPLNEVVLGVQFAPIKGYSQIYAGEIWRMFRDKFPLIEEQAPLPPQFETFGRQELQASIQLLTGATQNRFWFLTEKKEELIQFQPDRLLHNWRKVGDETNPYPRFETMIAKFEQELGGVENYFLANTKQTLSITQTEISYINFIPCEAEPGCPAHRWLRFLNFDPVQPNDFSMNFRRVLNDDAGKPYARLNCEAQTALAGSERKHIIRFMLTVRGAPGRPDIPATLEFLAKGREIIVNAFTDLTTESAHKVWERTK
jgi:uncharacterized protein (TIGR04255 family)